MRKLLLTVVAIAVSAPLLLVGQDLTQQLKDFTRRLPIDGIQLSLVYMNERVVPMIFQPPTMYAMRARLKESTLIYVQGTAAKDFELDTSAFSLDQGGQNTVGEPSNIKNFVKGKAKLKADAAVTGVLTFMKVVDPSKPFSVKHGRESAEFRFSSDQVKAMTPPPAAN
jgi:hypothetical protein